MQFENKSQHESQSDCKDHSDFKMNVIHHVKNRINIPYCGAQRQRGNGPEVQRSKHAERGWLREASKSQTQ